MAKVADEVGSTANSYQILAKLAVGGMAEIFLARGASVAGVERYCVLKRILRERAGEVQFAQMFLDEARLVAQLQHPNIASVYDIGMLGDSYFFTMEYVHGETVRSLLQRAQTLHRPVPLACALTIIAGAASGLHHAHERHAHDGQPLGIVHRDVSPSNLMVSYEGNVKIVDFGVAKAANRVVETHAGTVKGKISYLSPEQCRGARVDRRSDLFSLGIVMWEVLTGARLYRRDTDFETMTAIVHEPPPPPSSRRSEVPRAVDDIVLRLLAKSLDTRFQTAAEVVEAIENASMRAGTILSVSAVSRLVRDLFGERAEPWLALDAETLSHQGVSVMSQPLATELATSSDAIDRELADRFDLSGPGASSALVEMRDTSGRASLGGAVEPARRATTGSLAPSTEPMNLPARRAPVGSSSPPLGAAIPVVPAVVADPPSAPPSSSIPTAAPGPGSSPVRAVSPSPGSGPIAAPIAKEPRSGPIAAGATAGSGAPSPAPAAASPAAPQAPGQASPLAALAALAAARSAPNLPVSTLLGVAAPSQPHGAAPSQPPGASPSSAAPAAPARSAAGPPAAVVAAATAVTLQVPAAGYGLLHPAPAPRTPAALGPPDRPSASEVTTMRHALGRSRRRIGWPLLGILVVGSALGVIAAVLSTLGDGDTADAPAPAAAHSVAVAPAVPPPATARATPQPATTAPATPHSAVTTPATLAPAAPAAAAPAPAATAPTMLLPVKAEHAASSDSPPATDQRPSTDTRDSDAATGAGDAATSTAAAATGRDDVAKPAPKPPATAPAAKESVERKRARGPPARPADPAGEGGAPVEVKARPPTRPAIAQRAPTGAELTDLMRNDDHAGVVRLCSATTVTSQLAPACVLAACYQGVAAKAKRWLTAYPGSKKPIVTRCQQLNVVID